MWASRNCSEGREGAACSQVVKIAPVVRLKALIAPQLKIADGRERADEVVMSIIA
jgi:hypothetical protein